jgi:hypothetical protein
VERLVRLAEKAARKAVDDDLDDGGGDAYADGGAPAVECELRVNSGGALACKLRLEVPAIDDTKGEVASGLEGPAASGLEGPAASGLEGPAASGLEGPAASGLEGALASWFASSENADAAVANDARKPSWFGGMFDDGDADADADAHDGDASVDRESAPPMTAFVASRARANVLLLESHSEVVVQPLCAAQLLQRCATLGVDEMEINECESEKDMSQLLEKRMAVLYAESEADAARAPRTMR